MSQSSKLFLGLITISPIVLLAIFFSKMFSFIIEMAKLNKEPTPQEVLTPLAGWIVLAVIMGLVTLALMIYYIIHAINNKSIDGNERIVWILVFVFVPMIGFPLYWLIRIWRTNRGDNYSNPS